MTNITAKLKKDPNAFKTLELNDLKLLRAQFGKNVTTVEDISEQVNMIIHIDNIQMPLDRKGFKQICTSLHRQCSQQ